MSFSNIILRSILFHLHKPHLPALSPLPVLSQFPLPVPSQVPLPVPSQVPLPVPNF